MVWFPILIVAIVLVIATGLIKGAKWGTCFVLVFVFMIGLWAINGICYGVYKSVKTADTEVWSGVFATHSYKPPEDHVHTRNVCSTDSNNNTTCTAESYPEHHPAAYRVKTSDDGWTGMDYIPKNNKFCPQYAGRSLNDYWPLNVAVLEQCWPKGSPSASTHIYVNKVQASYSVFRHHDLESKAYPNLPVYPRQVHDDFYVDRVLMAYDMAWDKKNLQDAVWTMHEANGRIGHDKQVNMILAVFPAGVPAENAMAMQDVWEGGNKNDFVLAIGVNPNGAVEWAYPFSWSEVEELKIELRDWAMSQKVTDLVPVVQEMERQVQAKFVRKQFADFNYLNIQPPHWLNVVDWVLTVIFLIFAFFVLAASAETHTQYDRRYRY